MQLPTTRLSRLEWSVLRGALGRPRRLSAAFLREERLRLEGYRWGSGGGSGGIGHGGSLGTRLGLAGVSIMHSGRNCTAALRFRRLHLVHSCFCNLASCFILGIHLLCRSHARLKYEEVGMGLELPAELPRQLRVGQEVTARHPTSRLLHDGVILTAKHNKYK